MSDTQWWDPPKNSEGGGFIQWEKNDDTFDYKAQGAVLFCGFYTEKEGFLGNKNESHFYHSFFKFEIPEDLTVEDVESAHITVKVANVVWSLGVDHIPVGYPIKVYAAPPRGPWFPHASELTALGDMYAGTENITGYWEYVGEWEDIWNIAVDYAAEDIHWLSFFNVTDSLKYAISGGLDWLAIRLVPKYDAPYDWNYDSYSTGEECWASFYGAKAGTSVWGDMPEGYPDQSGIPVPQLRIVVTSGEQWVPGEENIVEEIACIGSDYASQSALIGTTAGGLWRTWDGGTDWAKIFEVTSSGTLASGMM